MTTLYHCKQHAKWLGLLLGMVVCLQVSYLAEASLIDLVMVPRDQQGHWPCWHPARVRGAMAVVRVHDLYVELAHAVVAEESDRE